MKRIYLLIVHELARIRLWSAELELDNASRIIIEANEELDRAVQLSARLVQKREDARHRAMLSGHRIDVHERRRFLGI